jgi:uncharacterized protein (DUF302 family)
MLRALFLVILTTTLALAGCSPAGKEADTGTKQAAAPSDKVEDYITEYTTTKYPYDDVAQNVEWAITGRGYVIDDHAFIGRMLERTKPEGRKKVFENAQQFRFCPSLYSRRMMEADPKNITFCPYIIIVYNTPDDPKTTHVMFRKPQIVGSKESKAALKSVDDLLDSIIKEALQ